MTDNIRPGVPYDDLTDEQKAGVDDYIRRGEDRAAGIDQFTPRPSSTGAGAGAALLAAVDEAIRERALPATVQRRLTAAYNAVVEEATEPLDATAKCSTCGHFNGEHRTYPWGTACLRRLGTNPTTSNPQCPCPSGGAVR